MGNQRPLTSAALCAGSLVCVLVLTGCGEVVQAESERDQKSVLVLDRGPHTESDESPAESEASDGPREGAQTEEFSLAELQDMDYEQFRSGEVSQEQRFQLLWHYAELSSDYAEHFAPEEGLDAYNPVETASAEDEPQEILDQYWYLNQLYHLGELLAEEHGGTDISMKLARVVDRGNVRELESMLDSTELEAPAWLLESRYELMEADECLRPPDGTETAIPWDEQVCWELEFEITQGEATSLMPYFHWTEFETAEGDTVGFWNRSALHWL